MEQSDLLIELLIKCINLLVWDWRERYLVFRNENKMQNFTSSQITIRNQATSEIQTSKKKEASVEWDRLRQTQETDMNRSR